MKKIFLMIIILVAVATTLAWGLQTDAVPEGAVPAPEETTAKASPPSPAKTASNDPKTGWNLRVPPAGSQTGGGAPAPPKLASHPPTIRGHHPGAGHKPVYQEVKKWNPGSRSFVEARDKKVAAEAKRQLQDGLKKEKAERQGAVSAISKRIEPLEEKKNSASLVWLVAVFILGLTVVMAVGITQN